MLLTGLEPSDVLFLGSFRVFAVFGGTQHGAADAGFQAFFRSASLAFGASLGVVGTLGGLASLLGFLSRDFLLGSFRLDNGLYDLAAFDFHLGFGHETSLLNCIGLYEHREDVLQP